MKKIWITSWPHGEAKIVEVIEERKDLRRGMERFFYIRKPNGGTDTTTSEFLFDLPEGLDKLNTGKG